MYIPERDRCIIISISIFIIGLFLGTSYSYKIFDNIYFKILLFLFIIWTSTIDILLSAIIAVIILVMYQLILKVSINEGFVPYTENNNEYLENPLLKNDQLEKLGDNIDFTLITPKMNNIKLVEDGKKLLEISNNLKTDLNTRYDTREKDIMDDTYIMGSRMIKSGMNNLVKSDGGEYYGDILQKDIDNPNIIYISNKNSESDMNYDNITSNNEIIKNKFKNLANNKTISRQEFDKKYNEIKKMQSELLIVK